MISRAAAIVIMITGCATNSMPTQPADGPDIVVLKRQVADTERAFARTMASRDHQAFASFLSQEAVFFSGPKPLRGAQQVAEWWKRYYEGPDAPFSWQPEDVEVLDSGTLAISSGPRPQGSPHRHFHIDLAAGGHRDMAHHLRQGQRSLPPK